MVLTASVIPSGPEFTGTVTPSSREAGKCSLCSWGSCANIWGFFWKKGEEVLGISYSTIPKPEGNSGVLEGSGIREKLGYRALVLRSVIKILRSSSRKAVEDHLFPYLRPQ